MRFFVGILPLKTDIFQCYQKVSDCFGVESVGSRFFKPLSEIHVEVGDRSVRVSVSEIEKKCRAQLC